MMATHNSNDEFRNISNVDHEKITKKMEKVSENS